jgi:hypothetical protein
MGARTSLGGARCTKTERRAREARPRGIHVLPHMRVRRLRRGEYIFSALPFSSKTLLLSPSTLAERGVVRHRWRETLALLWLRIGRRRLARKAAPHEFMSIGLWPWKAWAALVPGASRSQTCGGKGRCNACL